jgi:hypothetical protein
MADTPVTLVSSRPKPDDAGAIPGGARLRFRLKQFDLENIVLPHAMIDNPTYYSI